MRKVSFLFIYFLLLLLSCNKDDDLVFHLTLISTSPTELNEFQENLIVEIEEEFDVSFSPEQIGSMTSLKIILDEIKKTNL